MKTLALTSALVIVLTSSPFLHPAAAQADVESLSRAHVTLDSSRPQWPTVREPSGGWGVVGEAIARHTGGAPVTVQSIGFSILNGGGRVLLHEIFDTPEALSSVLLVSRQTASGAPDWKPAGTTVLDPGDTGIAFLVGLTERQFAPAMVRVMMLFDRAPARTLFVPLQAFATKQQMGWPLPFDGRRWIAFNTAGTVHHWVSSTVLTERAVFSSRRFALDIVQIDDQGQTHLPTGSGKESYYAWGEPVLSAGGGRVVAIMIEQRDHEIGEAASPLEHPGGNFVVIQHGPRLFSVYAHMQQASAAVNVGDWVERGDIIGRVGNSGDSTQPHLHVHFTDAWLASNNPLESFAVSQGVPALFWGAQVYRNGNFFDMNGSTPLEFDIVVSVDAAR